MNARQMRYVVVLSEELNFSHAAQRLYISQPSLSQCIRAVEDDLGVQLFDRSGGHVSLTPAGAKYVELARQILTLLERLKDDVRQAGQAGRGQLRVGVSDSGSVMSPLFIPELQRRFPDTQISFVEQPVGELELLMLDGELDLIFTMPPLQQLDRLSIIPILEDDFLMACPRAFPAIQAYLAGQTDNAGQLAHPQTLFPAVPWPLLRQLPFISVKRKRFDQIMDQKLGDPGEPRPRVIMEVANVITALSMAAAGNGICPVPGTIVRLGVQDPRLFYCRIDELFPTCALAVSYPRGQTLSPAARTYIELLTAYVREHRLDHLDA